MEAVERVLVLPRERVPGGCDFTGIRRAGEPALHAMRKAVATHAQFLERPIAEANPAFKQLIPYVVVRNGELVFLMERSDGGGAPVRGGSQALLDVRGVDLVDHADQPQARDMIPRSGGGSRQRDSAEEQGGEGEGTPERPHARSIRTGRGTAAAPSGSGRLRADRQQAEVLGDQA